MKTFFVCDIHVISITSWFRWNLIWNQTSHIYILNRRRQFSSLRVDVFIIEFAMTGEMGWWPTNVPVLFPYIINLLSSLFFVTWLDSPAPKIKNPRTVTGLLKMNVTWLAIKLKNSCEISLLLRSSSRWLPHLLGVSISALYSFCVFNLSWITFLLFSVI